MSRFANSAVSSSPARSLDQVVGGCSVFGLSKRYIAVVDDLLNNADVPDHGTAAARQSRLLVAGFVALAVLVSALCASAAVLIMSNDAGASVTRVVEQSVVTTHHEIDERFNSFLRDIRAIEIGPNGLVRIPGSAPVLAMHIEPPAPTDIRGRIEEGPSAYPVVTIVQEIKPAKKRRVRRIRIARTPAAVPEKSLFETLFGVPFPLKLFPQA